LFPCPSRLEDLEDPWDPLGLLGHHPMGLLLRLNLWDLLGLSAPHLLDLEDHLPP